MNTKKKLIIGIGNRQRGDDGAGREAAERLKSLCLPNYDICEADGEPSNLMSLWGEYEDVILIDAICSGDSPQGSLHAWDVSEQPLPTDHRLASSHDMGLAEAIELSRVLGTLPTRIRVIGIEASCFDWNAALTPAVNDAILQITDAFTFHKEDDFYARIFTHE